MLGHIIVCGDDALAMRIVEELNNSGATVLTVQTPDGLAAAGLAEAQAVICVADDDELNLEIALLARQASPDVRVVARLANGVLRDAMAADNGPGAILDVADLTASSVVEACLSRTTHTHRGRGHRLRRLRRGCPQGTPLCERYTAISHPSG